MKTIRLTLSTNSLAREPRKLIALIGLECQARHIGGKTVILSYDGFQTAELERRLEDLYQVTEYEVQP